MQKSVQSWHPQREKIRTRVVQAKLLKINKISAKKLQL
jgi:hypothetical protein